MKTAATSDDTITFLRDCSKEDIHKLQKDFTDSCSLNSAMHRRMTLAEFTGLDGTKASVSKSPKIQKSSSNLFLRSPRLKHMSRRTSHMLEVLNERGRRASVNVLAKMNLAHRSSSNSRRNSSEIQGETVHSFFQLTENVTDHEKAFLAHLDMSSEPSAISKLQLKMKDLRRALQQKLMGLPCKCEQRLQDLQMVKAFTMESLFEFNSGFKALFRNATKMIGNHSGINPKNFQKHMLILERCIQLFENIGSKIVKIMEYSGNIFTAQLIYARTEELLDAIEVILAETGRVDRHELPDVIVRNSKLMGEALNQFSISIAGL
uniref:Protein kinase domain-containing protein n=1 Tax=Rhabditophanes sp. KR3021 TaxID=114890 RepID=A0AC35TYP9_9BILA